jgi:hypothetical protein
MYRFCRFAGATTVDFYGGYLKNIFYLPELNQTLWHTIPSLLAKL